MNKEEMFEQMLAMTYDIRIRASKQKKYVTDYLSYKEIKELYTNVRKQYLEILKEKQND
jgi:methyl coenzyme M reductase subunit D